MNVTTVKIRLALKLETHWQQCEHLSLTRMIRTHTHTVYATHATVVGTGMKLSFRRSDNQPRKNAPKPPPCTLTRTTCKNLLSGMCVYVYTSQILTVIAESIVSNKVDIWMSSNFNLFTAHTHTHISRSIPALTVTDPLADKTPHASGRARCWSPPFSLGCTPRNMHKPHTHFIVGIRLHTHTHRHTHTPHITVRKTLHP